MNRCLILSLLTLTVLLSCNSTKKVVQSTEVTHDSTCTAISYRLERFCIDTTKTADWHIVVSEEEYYPATDTTKVSIKRKVTKTISHKSETKGVTCSSDSVTTEVTASLKSNVAEYTQEQSQTRSAFSVPWWVWVSICFGAYIIIIVFMRKFAKK